ncbi:helix-turn-helix transcriptional regulator, partial [Mycobacterium sp.]|uniref:helix-turn-helix transcriptional regulator n=1 Tax=Mycobacterium sp. TaxID=1785 RepID=UPI002D792459
PLGAFAPWVAPTVGDAVQLVQVVRGVIDALTSAAPGTTVVVGVDDAHLLDELSTFVLQQIVQRRAAKLLVTVRDAEPIPAGLQEIWKEGHFSRLVLLPLSRNETTTLVSEALDGPLDPDAAQRLWKLTQGNVLYLRTIVEQECADGRLTKQHGRWRWTGDPVVPPGLIELIESRIGAIAESVRDVVDVLAVGEPLALASLTTITSRAAVEDADARGLITLSYVDDRAEARLAHPLYGEVRRKRAAPTRLRRVRGLVAAELATAGNTDVSSLVRRATLALDSDLDLDPNLLVEAADGAMFLADAPLADRLAAAAIRAGAGVEAYNIRSFALAWQGRGEDADAVAAATPIEGLAEAERVFLLGHRAFNSLWGLADPEGAKKLFDEASRIATTATRHWIDAYMTVYWVAVAQLEQARTSGQRLDIQQLPAIVGAAAAWALVVAHGDAGRTAEALSAAEAGYAHVARTAGAAHMRLLIVDKHVGVLLQCGRIAEASEVAEQARRHGADLPGVPQHLSAAIAGRAAMGAGRLGEASSLLSTVVDQFLGDANGFRYRYLIPLTTALAMCGLSDQACSALQVLEAERHRSWGFVDYERGLAHAWVAATQGALTDAISTALSTAATARENGQFAAEVMCLQTATQFGERSGVTRLRELAEIVEGPRIGVVARFAGALAAGDGTELALVSEEFERMGDLVAAGDAAAHAAIVYRAKGLRGSALSCSTRADALAEQCGGALTPAIRRASERVPLTEREREIVMLLGEGLSTRAVAERLTLSVRTVENHIYKAMSKTGTATRDELAALLPRRRSTPRR